MKHGFGSFVEQMNLQRFIPFGKRLTAYGHWPYPEKSSIPGRLRVAFSELGPTFIKLAQILSSRPDLITVAYADEFKKLQDNVPPFPFAQAKTIIEREFQTTLEDLFMFIDPKPIAAASIAQVHNAILRDGSPVIVKIQRPFIKKIIETDMEVLQILTRLMVRYIPDTQFINPTGIMEEFARTIKKELLFTLEVRNAERFRANFAHHNMIYIPKIYHSLVTDSVFVMERIEGVKIDRIDQIDEMGFDRKKLAVTISDIYFKQIFEDGYFHADPHPGNIFVLNDGRIGLIDFGMVGILSADLMEAIADTLLAFVSQDYDGLVDLYERLGLTTGEIDIEEFRREFKADLMEALSPFYTQSLGELNIADILETVSSLAIKHGLKAPRDLILVNRTLLFLEHLGHKLDPSFRVVDEIKPHAIKLMTKKLHPDRIMEKAKRNMKEISDLLLTTPKHLRALIRKAIKDDFTLSINVVGLDRIIRDYDRSTNRLAFSVVLAAVIVSSSILIIVELQEKTYAFPFFGFLGYMIAFILSVFFIFSIIRSGRL
jgi:ubiquinone biosynthesis protein